MSSPLTDKINALTTYANEITGESDTTLSDAVATLASGYGQGGGGGSTGLVYEEGTYTAASNDIPTISFSGSHSEAPVFVAFVDSTGTAQTTTQKGVAFSFVRLDAFVPGGIPFAGKTSDGIYSTIFHGASSDSGAGGNWTAASSVTASGFTPYFGSTARTCQSGRTYKWIAVWK